MFKNIKRLRTKNHLSQREIADIVGITQQQVNNIENGHSNPGYDTIMRLSDHFNVSIDYLFRDSDEEYYSHIHEDVIHFFTDADKAIHDELYEQLSDENKFFISDLIKKLLLAQKALS